MVAALEKVEQGETFISPSISNMGKRRSNRVQELLLSKPQIEDLTSAERRILKFIDYYNDTMAKPYKWTYAGRVLNVGSKKRKGSQGTWIRPS